MLTVAVYSLLSCLSPTVGDKHVSLCSNPFSSTLTISIVVGAITSQSASLRSYKRTQNKFFVYCNSICVCHVSHVSLRTVGKEQSGAEIFGRVVIVTAAVINLSEDCVNVNIMDSMQM